MLLAASFGDVDVDEVNDDVSVLMSGFADYVDYENPHMNDLVRALSVHEAFHKATNNLPSLTGNWEVDQSAQDFDIQDVMTNLKNFGLSNLDGMGLGEDNER